jgi:hypothetical protein
MDGDTNHSAAPHSAGKPSRRAAELTATEVRIWSLLEPYRDELEDATIYGMPSLRWPGTKAHDYFAAVRQGKSHVSLYLLVADTYPDALKEASETLLRRRSGKATFNFSNLDDQMAADLEQLLTRLYAHYRSAHAPHGGPLQGRWLGHGPRQS